MVTSDLAAKLNIFYAVLLAKFFLSYYDWTILGHLSWDSIKHEARPQETRETAAGCFPQVNLKITLVSLVARFSTIKRYTHPITQLRRLFDI